jgi:hypothetical protein
MSRVSAVGLIFTVAAFGCSDDETSTSTSSSSNNNGGGSAQGGAGGAGGGTGAGNNEGGGVETTDCVDPAVNGAEVYSTTEPPLLNSLVAVGNRFMASGDEGFVFFDADGSNADATPTMLGPSVGGIDATGSRGGVTAYDVGIRYQRVDEDGQLTGVPAGISTNTPLDLVVTENGQSTIIWGFNSRIDARVMTDAGGFAGDAFTVTYDAFSSFLFLKAAKRQGQVGIVWSGDPLLGFNHSHFILMDEFGAMSGGHDAGFRWGSRQGAPRAQGSSIRVRRSIARKLVRRHRRARHWRAADPRLRLEHRAARTVRLPRHRSQRDLHAGHRGGWRGLRHAPHGLRRHRHAAPHRRARYRRAVVIARPPY